LDLARISSQNYIIQEGTTWRRENISSDIRLKSYAQCAHVAKTRVDWEQAAAMTEEEIAAAIASDPDEAGMVIDWSTTSTELPQPKKVLNMRIDADVLQFFRREGKGYQTKINAVLRSYVDQQRRHEMA